MGEGGLMQMKMKRILCVLLLVGLLASLMAAHADQLERVWMEYEDYSGVRSEQAIEDAKTLEELEKILQRASRNRAELEGCTVNCTLFCMTKDGDIVDFACATDGCPYIQNRQNDATYTLGLDYQRFWEIFAEVKTGMGYDASSVFDW